MTLLSVSVRVFVGGRVRYSSQKLKYAKVQLTMIIITFHLQSLTAVILLLESYFRCTFDNA